MLTLLSISLAVCLPFILIAKYCPDCLDCPETKIAIDKWWKEHPEIKNEWNV